MSISRTLRLASRIVCCAIVPLVASLPARADVESHARELKLYATEVAVQARVECPKYEGSVLNCTINAFDAVRESLVGKAILGFAKVSIDGSTYPVEPVDGKTIRFYPQRGEGPKKDYSGQRQVTIEAIFAQ